jgi:ACS family glucarate transporter-like MFS transporter
MTTPRSKTSRMRVRWWIFGFMFIFSFLSYLERQASTVAGTRMMPELGLSQVQFGFLFWAFMLSYTFFQLGSAVYGQRWGARWMFVGAGAMAALAVLATPLAPSLLAGAPLFIFLIAAQLALGIAQAPLFPVASGVFEAWFPARRWPLVQGLESVGQNLGAALAPPLIATIMAGYGWRQAVATVGIIAVPFIALWAWFGRDTPGEHPLVTHAELAELAEDQATTRKAFAWSGVRRLLVNRDVLRITASYCIMNYVFYLLSVWSFLYLVQARHFSEVESGWLAAGPPLAAALGAGLGGKIAEMLCDRFGARWGFRLVPLVALPAAGACLVVVATVQNGYWAAAALSVAYGFVELVEGPAWGAVMYIAREETMAATGILNTGGCIGGLIGIPIVAYLSEQRLWTTAIVIGSLAALVSGLVWLGADASRRVDVQRGLTAQQRPALV